MKTTLSMDRRYIEDNQIIDRYLMSKLSEEEMEAFEEFFLEDAELVQEIEVRKRFIRGIRKADRTGLLELGDDESSSMWQRLPVMRPSFATVAAVSAAILLIVAVLQYSQITRLQSVNQEQVNQIGQLTAPQVNTLLVPLGRTRGATTRGEPVIRVHLSSEVEQVILELDIESLGFDNYRLSLDREGAGQLWSSDSDNAPPAVVLPAELLIPGDYYLQIHGARSGNELVPVAQFSFTVLDN
jgi:hypothetical protein